MKYLKILSATGLLSLLNVGVAFAAVSTFADLIEQARTAIITPLVGIIWTLAVVYFLWGVTKYVRNAGDPSERNEGIQMMIWGSIGLAVMLSYAAIVSVVRRTANLQGDNVSISSQGDFSLAEKVSFEA